MYALLAFFNKNQQKLKTQKKIMGTFVKLSELNFVMATKGVVVVLMLTNPVNRFFVFPQDQVKSFKKMKTDQNLPLVHNNEEGKPSVGIVISDPENLSPNRQLFLLQEGNLFHVVDICFNEKMVDGPVHYMNFIAGGKGQSISNFNSNSEVCNLNEKETIVENKKNVSKDLENDASTSSDSSVDSSDSSFNDSSSEDSSFDSIFEETEESLDRKVGDKFARNCDTDVNYPKSAKQFCQPQRSEKQSEKQDAQANLHSLSMPEENANKNCDPRIDSPINHQIVFPCLVQGCDKIMTTFAAINAHQSVSHKIKNRDKRHLLIQRGMDLKIPADIVSCNCSRFTIDGDYLVFCDQCNYAVHGKCYGIPDGGGKDEAFLCKVCCQKSQ